MPFVFLPVIMMSMYFDPRASCASHALNAYTNIYFILLVGLKTNRTLTNEYPNLRHIHFSSRNNIIWLITIICNQNYSRMLFKMEYLRTVLEWVAIKTGVGALQPNYKCRSSNHWTHSFLIVDYKDHAQLSTELQIHLFYSCAMFAYPHI